MVIEGSKVLVTGGAGFVGSHLVDRLIEEHPTKLVVIDNMFLGREENLAEARQRFPDLKLYKDDATNLQRMREILTAEEIEIVFDMATIPLPASLVKPRWASRVIFDLTLNLCELCKEGAFKTLVHCSTSEAYGSAVYVPMNEEHPLNSHTPYAAAKAAADLTVHSYWQTFGIDVATVRPFNAYGPRQNDRQYAGIVPFVIRRILRGRRPIIYGDGEQTRDYSFVKDTVEGIVAVAKSNRTRGMVVNIASGRECRIKDLVHSICEALGFEGEPIYQATRAADVRRHLADISLAEHLLGYEPRVDLEQGVQETVEWYREKYRREGLG